MRQCSLVALEANIAEMVKSGHSRDQAVAAAHAMLRESCRDEGKPTPSAKDVAGVAKKFKRQPGERTTDYLETALAAAREKLNPRDFAVIHQAARSRAGGLASGRARTTVEKGLLFGPQLLTVAELDDAHERAETYCAADLRLGVDTGGEYLAQLFWAEKSRRDVQTKASERKKAKKGEPTPSDAHVNKPLGKEDEEQDGISVVKSDDPSVIIALRLPAATANAIAIADGEAADKLHVTLVDLGRMSELGPEGLMLAADAIGQVTSTPALKGVLSGIGRFAATDTSDGKDVIVRMVDVPGLNEMRAQLCEALEARGVDYSRVHDFTPHLTLAYVDRKKAMALRSSLQDVYFDAIVLSVNDADTSFLLGQADPLADARQAMAEAQSQENSMPVVAVEEVTTAGEARVRACDSGDLMDRVEMSAVDVEPGDVVELGADVTGGFHVQRASASWLPAPFSVITKSAEALIDQAKHETIVPFVGPDDAAIVFVSGAPSELELARGEPLVGPDGAEFVGRYLRPLGVSKSEVAIGFACPVLPRVAPFDLGKEQTNPWKDYVFEQLARWPNATVIAVGKAAADALGDHALMWLPHPLVARRNEDRYAQQIDRKIRRIRKSLDDGFAVVKNNNARPGQPEILTVRIGESQNGHRQVLARVAKSEQDKQIVYGVVLDPYEIDTQEEWSPPAMIEETAHGYLKRSRVVGREHTRKAMSEVVESWVEQYPTPEDYRAALALQPHRAYVRPFGDSVIHSGSWAMGVHLGDAEWDAYKRGEITGFSIGGFSAKVAINKDAMPKVEFIDLGAQRSVA